MHVVHPKCLTKEEIIRWRQTHRVCMSVWKCWLSFFAPFFHWNLIFFYERARQKGSWNQHKAQNDDIETRKLEQTMADREIEYVRSVGRSVRSNIVCLFIKLVSNTEKEMRSVAQSPDFHYWFPYRTTPHATAVCKYIRDTHIMSFAFVCFLHARFLIILIFVGCDCMLISVDSTNFSITLTMTWCMCG